jgi:hypothetical protein
MSQLSRRVSYLGVLGLAVLVGSAADLRAQTNQSHGPAVVELYTSQGCSSCPPADRVLGELSMMPNVIALAFHVDYWDNIGWRDHYSIQNAVERQHRYVEALGLRSAFTPQAVVDGRSSFVGSDKRGILDALADPIGETVPVIRANVISPGTIDTPILAPLPKQAIAQIVASIPMGRMGSADEIAKAALFLASDDSSFVTGIELFVDGGTAQV